MSDLVQRRVPLKTYSGAVKRALTAEFDEAPGKRRRGGREALMPAGRNAVTGTLDTWMGLSSPTMSSSEATASSDAADVSYYSSPASSPPPPRSGSECDECQPCDSTCLPTASSRATIRASAKSKRVRSSQLVQMQINVGRDVQKTCKDCGMTFVPSDPQDVALHDRHHSRNEQGIDLGKSFRNASSLSVRGSGKHGGSIVVVDSDSRSFERRKASEVLEFVQSELGAVAIDEHDLWAQDQVSGSVAANRYRVFLYLVGTRCVGLCLAKRISSAFEIRDDKLGPPSNLKESTDTAISVASISVPARLGISRIWTSKCRRGQGIATALLDCAAQRFEPGWKLPRAQVAFSQPTTAGLALARRWHGKSFGWLIYLD